MNRFLFFFFVVLSFKINAFNLHVSEVMVNPSFTGDAVGEFIEIYSDSILNDTLEIVYDQNDTLHVYCDWIGYQVLARETLLTLFPNVSIRSVSLPSLINSRSFSLTLAWKGQLNKLDSIWVPISTQGGFSWHRIDKDKLFEKSQAVGLTSDFESMGLMSQVKDELFKYVKMLRFDWDKSKVTLNGEGKQSLKGLSLFVDNDLDGEPDKKLDNLLKYEWSQLESPIEIELVNHWLRIGLVHGGKVEFFSFCDPSYLECGPLTISQVFPFTEEDETEWIEWEMSEMNFLNSKANFILKKNEDDSISFLISDLVDRKNQKIVTVADSLRFRDTYGAIRISLNEFEKWLSLNNSGGNLFLKLDGVQLGSWVWPAVEDSSRGKALKCDNGHCATIRGSGPGKRISPLSGERTCSLFSEMMNPSNRFLIIEGIWAPVNLISSVGKVYAVLESAYGSDRIISDLSLLSLPKGKYYLKNEECFKTVFWGF